MKMNSTLYLPFWYFKARLFGKKNPLQSVVFISNKCNLACKHCNVYSHKEPIIKTYEQIKDELQFCFDIGSRFIDFEGGEPTLWTDGEYDLNSLIRLAKGIGFFSTTVTTNAIKPFHDLECDSIWVSLDGLGEYHDKIRGKGAFEKLIKNIETCGHPHLNVNMAVNSINYLSVEETIEFAKNNPYIKSISINFHTPYPETEDLFLNWDTRIQIIDKIIEYKRKKYPIINSVSGLKLMKHNKFKKQCWISNFILPDGTRLSQCAGSFANVCDRCGFCMAGEMRSVMTLKPDTILAGMSLRM